MKTYLISALLLALRGEVGAELLKFLQVAARTVMASNITGAEKKALILEQAKALGGAVADQLASASGWALNLAIELLVARLKLEGGDRPVAPTTR